MSGGVDWKQEKLKSSGTTSTDVYKRDTTGLYLTGQQQIDSVTLEASGREDHDEQFGWHGTADGRRLGIYRRLSDNALVRHRIPRPSLGQQYGAERFGIASNPNLKPEESKQWEAGLEGLTGPVDWRSPRIAMRFKTSSITTTTPITTSSRRRLRAGVDGNITTGPVEHHLTLQYVDPRDDETNKILYRRAKQQVKYELNGRSTIWGGM